MSQATIETAQARHQQEQHPDEFLVCLDPQRRAAATEINRESAIENMRKVLKFGKRA